MATVSLANLVTQLRSYLSDPTTGQVKWVDSDLELFIKDAVTIWTTDLPIPSSQAFDVVSGQHEYDLPEDLVEAWWVKGYFASASVAEFAAPLEVDLGAWQESYEPIGFLVDFSGVGKFYLPRLPQGSSFTLYYGATHAELGAATDLDLGRQTWGRLAVLAYAAFLALSAKSVARAQLEQHARKTDLNVDNPLEQEARRWLTEYERLMARYAEPVSFRFLEQ